MKLPQFLYPLVLVAGLAACTTAGTPDVSEMSFSEKPLIGKFIWHDLITEDIGAATRFYSGLFGWTFEESTGARGNDYTLAKSGGVYVAGIVPMAPPADGSDISRWLPYASVGDVDAAVRRTTERGGTVAVSVRDVSLGRVAAIIDPQGAVIGLASSDIGDPDDATTAAKPGRVVWTELLASDVDAAAVFYSAVVGYQTKTIERRGGEYVMLENDGIRRAGIFHNPMDGWEPEWLTFFAVSDPAAVAARVESLGGEVLIAPTPEVREGTLALVTDPSGAVLALQKWPLQTGSL
ncbi:MAG: VOC family protein [Gammaproteobacteria bacterium]